MSTTAPTEQAGDGRYDRDWVGRRVVGHDRATLGTLEHVYVGRESEQPTWGVVKLGRNQHVVPLFEATPRHRTVQVPVDKRQVRTAPAVPAGTRLGPETEAQLARHYAHGQAHYESGADLRHRDANSAAPIRRRQSPLTGILFIVIGIWAALIPFVGPYFGYGFGPDRVWLFTLDRLGLSILPGVAVLLGGLLLASAVARVTAGLGSGLALAGGVWFVIGPALSQLWGNPGPAAPIGQPFGGNLLQAVEHVGFFYGPGALVAALAAFALGRLTVPEVRDPDAAWRRAERPDAAQPS